MARLRALFIVQGEGRGHLTQALAFASILKKAGHSICKSVVTDGVDGIIPDFFEEGLGAPLIQVPSGHFFINQENRSIDWGRTLVSYTMRSTKLNHSFTILSDLIRDEQPDIIINFFEPLAAFFMLRERPKIPMVAVGHQYMFLHPTYQFPEGFEVQKISSIAFTRLVGLGAERRFALSLYDAPPLPDKKIIVMPPLLREELFSLPHGVAEPFFLIYLYHHSLGEDLIAWHEKNPSYKLHCFWNNEEAEKIWHYSDHLAFHHLHGRRFLDMMARCQGIATTSGFETLAEALYLGKPLMLNPLNRHFEQYCNVIDGTKMGAAIQTSDMNLDRLINFIPQYNFDATEYRSWVSQAEEMYVREVENLVSEYQS